MIVTALELDGEGVYVAWHELALAPAAVREQLPPLGVNEPPAPPSLHETVPPGAEGVPELVSLTVAV